MIHAMRLACLLLDGDAKACNLGAEMTRHGVLKDEGSSVGVKLVSDQTRGEQALDSTAC